MNFSSIKNRALERIFGPKRDEVTKDWRKLHNEELNDMYSSSNTVQVIKLRRMRWAGHVARMGERRGVYRVWWGSLRERDHLEDLGVGGTIILRWIFRKWNVGLWTGSIWFRRRTGGGLL
jgi:hypothetical protein